VGAARYYKSNSLDKKNYSIHSYLLYETKALVHPHLWPRSVKFAFAGWLGASVANKVEQVPVIASDRTGLIQQVGISRR